MLILSLEGGAPFGFIGCYIVAPAHRGKGYGLQPWHRAVAYLANHTIGLDGVVAQQANYRKSGFNYAYPNSRFVGAARSFFRRAATRLDEGETLPSHMARVGTIHMHIQIMQDYAYAI